MTVPKQCYINGGWRDSTGGKLFEVADPSTGAPVVSVADTSTPDWSDALDAAATSFPDWRESSLQERSRFLRALFNRVTEKSDELARVMSIESGKPLGESMAEINYGASFLEWYSELLISQRGEVSDNPTGDYQMQVTRQPVGPCLLITPWNFPLAMLTRKLGAALAAGCTAVIKPAALTPLTCAWLVNQIHELGLPPGVVNYLPTTDARGLSSEIMADPRLRKISFTGSTSVGSVLLKQAAENVQASSMELGGNAPFVIARDADVDKAVTGVMIAKFRNAGQACVAANRVLVPIDMRDEFVEKLVEKVNALKVDAWDIDGADMGPLVDASQVRTVESVVTGALNEGGQVRAGGRRMDRDGYFFEPTVIVDAPIGGETWSREIFGPVAAVYSYRPEDDVAALANQTEYGLVSYLYGRDQKQLAAVADAMESGMVAINRPIISEARAPFGGVKASGLGREGGTVGLEDYQVVKYVALQY
ncbi:NAD-dependent succinate-semialdehyde dehydrogenase [Nesterenkonia jeotgali]|uniref:NAD-dependent succinate-semialdehyde dehydrogenase n=1 Tax=Nesterenkonia jeotgali TaxID=317018 RepID=UPI0018DB3512|nr:NAD-dependent succinate-semialdehyde dehydrogenase [Nesterenkonia jeotgali]